MSTVANFWTAQLTKFQAGVAALIIAAAAVLTPAAIAHAQPDLMPTIPASPLTDIFGTEPILGPINFSADVPWWWFGTPDPNAAAAITPAPPIPGNIIFVFQPLALVPGFLQPVAGWFLNLLPTANICFGAFGGLGASFGPYGTITVRTGAC